MLQNKPLVSVICLCYNQAPFVEEALESVWGQTYEAIELIVVDDGSGDASVAIIEGFLVDKPEVQFLRLSENVGNCKAFNHGLKLCKGKYVIDLAADDVLMPTRVEEGVKTFETVGEEYAVNFTDAVYIDIHGNEGKGHYKRNSRGSIIEKIPQEWVYVDVLQRYFICTPTMMMSHAVLKALGGYDDSLAYEDFDFWVRSARRWKYCFTDQVLVKKRIVPGSWSSLQYERKFQQLETTFLVCAKAKELNENLLENKALGKRLSYEIRQAIRNSQFEVARKMLGLKKEVYPEILKDTMYALLIYLRK